jgi:hypothetical protein
MKPSSEIDQLIETVGRSADVLESATYDAVCDFIRQSQSSSGAFIDRGGDSDWYYSLFGFMICKALNLQPELQKLEQFVLNSKNRNSDNLIEWAVWVLLRYSFKPRFFFKLRITFQLVLQWLKGRKGSNPVYLTFLSLLIVNHFWGWARCISIQIDRLTSTFMLNDQSPTSHMAAAMCIRNQAGLDTDDLTRVLLQNAHPEGGFVSFSDHETADMLSTAVAAYALNKANYDMGSITAEGLDFVSNQFDNGAFLSGDGDTTRDLEYTFYGLLSLSAYTGQFNEQ